MGPEIIDWDRIESVFIRDDTYEDLNAPKWVDFFSSEEPPADDDAWFCKPGCQHPKTHEDFLKTRRNSKVKFLRSVSISEMLPFKDRTWRHAKLKRPDVPHSQASKSAYNYYGDEENKDPNVSNPPLARSTMPKEAAAKASAEKNKKKRQQLDDNHSHASSFKPKLKSTFSARNLAVGRDILNQMAEFCSELKRLAKKGSKKESMEKVSSRVLGERHEGVRNKERLPLLQLMEEEI